MEWLLNFTLDYWLFFAIVLSFFWGTRAALFYSGISTVNNKRQKVILGVFEGGYQFIFHFVGSLAGWCCFYFLLQRIPRTEPWVRDFTTGDVLLFFISLIGLTGHLPQITYGVVISIKDVISKVSKKIEK